jgi:tripartite-type tricarboxylate transporter receptor subunit TctC
LRRPFWVSGNSEIGGRRPSPGLSILLVRLTIVPAQKNASPRGTIERAVLLVAGSWLVAVLLLFAMVFPTLAQQYPLRSVRIIVGFGAGSTADVLARLISPRLAKTLGQQFVVENRPGAGSMLAAEAVARAASDGHTLFMATIANVIAPALGAKFALSEEAPIVLIGSTPNVFIVHPSVSAVNVQELIALAKANPQGLTFASSGAGTAGHLSAELFNQRAGVHIVHVFYSGGSAQMAADLISGRVNLTFAVASTMLPQIQGEKLRALAVAQGRRAALLPNVPTMAEAGMPGFDASIWIGLLAPAGTPAGITDRIAYAVNEALHLDEVLAPMRMQGFDPLGGTPQEFATFIKADMQKWLAVTNEAGLRK